MTDPEQKGNRDNTGGSRGQGAWGIEHRALSMEHGAEGIPPSLRHRYS